MTEPSINKLTIIKASAGSGKTYRIAFEYIRILLQNPESFKNILAVTFTNKATAEMKSRIVENLKLIAQNNEQVENLVKDLSKATGLSTTEIQKSASGILQNILHEYQNFTITTIDHFFQKIIRALTRELNIGGGYTIQLDHTAIIDEAIQNLLNDVKPDSELMNVLIDFIDSQMDHEKSWNIQYQLTGFTIQLFREQVRHYFIKNNNTLTADSSHTETLVDINKHINSFKNELLKIITQFDELKDKAKIEEDDFTGKSRNPLLSAIKHITNKKYEKIPEVLPKIKDIEDWGHPKSHNRAIVNSLKPQFNQIIEQLETIYKNQYLIYLEAGAVLPNFYQHALASHIMNKVTEVLLNQNLFMLSDAPIVLSLLTGNNDTPFIYEKTGHRYRHFMIDEFQDTSELQWQNFRPLISESLANNNKGNFIVGDVKQAIYRWRNGDWSLLHKKVAQDIPNCETETLKNNYRSKENVVNFNNFLFNTATIDIAKELDDLQKAELTQMYDDVEQTIPEQIKEKHLGGYVFAQTIEGDTVATFKTAALEAMTIQIKRLQKEFHQTDICVLVRKNDEVSLVASHLIKNNFSIISSGSLALQNSSLIRLIISIFRYIILQDNFYLAAIKHEYLKQTNTDLHTIFTETTTDFLPDDFVQQTQKIAKLAPLQAITKIVKLFKLKEKYTNQDVFLSKFYNEVKKVSTTQGSNLKTIIEWWETEGSEKNVEVSEIEPNSIQIITLHKSKGLQFRNVIIPFAQWSPPGFPGTLWIEGEHFNISTLRNGYYPANLKKEHQKCTNLAPFYNNETFANIVDQFNMLYVATTRAEDNLFIFYWNKPDKNDVSAWIKHALNNQIENPTLKNSQWTSIDTFEVGQLEHMEKNSSTEEQNIKPIPIEIDFNSELQLKIKSNLYEFTHETDYTVAQTSKGSLLHRIFEQIRTATDIEKAVMKHVAQGVLTPDEGKTLIQKIASLIDHPSVSQWFNSDNIIMAEAEIILPKVGNRRPDRIIITTNETIVIDYKFGKTNEAKHTQQVSEYMNLLAQMGYKNILGYVWYPFRQEILTV